MLATTFEGYGLGNVTFADGPDGRWEWPVSTERSYSYARATWAPSGLKGFYTWHKDLAADVSNKALTSNVATLTTSAAHGFAVGQTVVVADVDSTFNGTHVITAVPSDTTFRFAKTASDVPSTVVTPVGTVVRQKGYAAVTALPGATDTSFNVPGNEDYNADEAIDFVIPSSEDPTA